MRKKDFSEIQTERVMQDLATSAGAPTQDIRPEATPEDKARRLAEMRTQGKKGCKPIRLHLILTPDNDDFLRIAAGSLGISKAEFINKVLDNYRRKHSDVIPKAKALMAEMELD